METRLITEAIEGRLNGRGWVFCQSGGERKRTKGEDVSQCVCSKIPRELKGR